ncbi:MAG TPA: TauD/TfdA family dioxygenase, partial [Orrella sp.]
MATTIADRVDHECTISFTPLHRTFMAQASAVDLRAVTDESSLATIRAGMARYGVLVFKGQQFTGQQQVAFAQRLDGELHRKTSSAVIAKNRYGDEALTDISNVDGDGSILSAE